MKKNEEITSIIMYFKKSERIQNGKNPEAKSLLVYFVKTIKKYIFIFFSFQVRNYGLYKNVPSVSVFSLAKFNSGSRALVSS